MTRGLDILSESFPKKKALPGDMVGKPALLLSCDERGGGVGVTLGDLRKGTSGGATGLGSDGATEGRGGGGRGGATGGWIANP